MSARRNGVIGLAVVAMGAAAAIAAEKAVMRKVRSGPDPDAGQDFAVPFETRHTLPSHDGGVINTVEAGEGPTVVLSHGVTLSVRTWTKQMEHLPERGFRTIAFDHRGHGESSVGEHGHTVENLAWDVRSVLEGLDLRDVVLVGHSMGGVAVQAFMVTFPEIAAERVAGVVLLSTLAQAPMSGHERLSQFVAAVADRGPDPGGLMNRKDIGYMLARVGFGREAQPARVEDLERDLEALAHVAEAVLRRHGDVLEGDGARVARLDPHLLLDLAEKDAGGVRVHDERRGAPLLLAVHDDWNLGKDREHAGVARVEIGRAHV